jgi:hypothetical protein
MTEYAPARLLWLRNLWRDDLRRMRKSQSKLVELHKAPLTDGASSLKDQVVMWNHNSFGVARSAGREDECGAVAGADIFGGGVEGGVAFGELTTTLEQGVPCHAHRGVVVARGGGGPLMMEEEEKAAGTTVHTGNPAMLAFTLRPFAPSMCSTGGASPQTTMPLSSGKFCKTEVHVSSRSLQRKSKVFKATKTKYLKQ